VIDLAQQDRGASLRICPTFAAATPAEKAGQFNVEFRATDASASPYLALGAIVHAGVDGLRRGLSLPDQDTAARPLLPRSLSEALDNLAGSEKARDWFGAVHLDAYLRHKRAEVAHVSELNPAELSARYAEVY
jgi:glutamine synthetase